MALILDSRLYRGQLDVLPMERVAASTVTVIGCGSLGSWTAVALAKLGVGRLVLYDGDVVEPHNLSVQLHAAADLGRNKAEALRGLIERFLPEGATGGAGQALEGRVVARGWHFVASDADSTRGIVVVCVDSLRVRRRVLRWLRRSDPRGDRVELLVDVRMGAEQLEVYTTGLEACAAYEASLCGEAAPAPCTAKATVYCAALAPAFVGSLLARHWRGETLPASLTFQLRWFYLDPNGAGLEGP